MRLKLDRRRWRTHYFPIVPLAFIFVLSCYVTFRVREVNPDGALILGFGTVFWLAAIIGIAWRQYNSLGFEEVSTSRSANQNYELVLRKMKASGWIVRRTKSDELIEAEVLGFPATALSWGEMVTVLFSENRVYINSICHPDRRSSITASGRNTKNCRAVVATLEAS